MARKYEIYFETLTRVSKGALARLIAERLPLKGFTLTKAMGAWEGKVNPSWVLTVVSAEELTEEIADTANFLKLVFQQEAVLITITPCEIITA